MTHAKKICKNLIVPRQQNNDDFAYIIRVQKLYNINIWLYTLCGEGKVALFKPVDDFNKDRNDVRILVWENAAAEHCAQIKTIDNLIDRPNENHCKYYYCSRCTYWFISQIDYDTHVFSHSFKHEIVFPKKKHITFINEHKRQKIKNIVTSDKECCVVNVNTISNKYVVAEQIPLKVSYKWRILGEVPFNSNVK